MTALYLCVMDLTMTGIAMSSQESCSLFRDIAKSTKIRLAASYASFPEPDSKYFLSLAAASPFFASLSPFSHFPIPPFSHSHIPIFPHYISSRSRSLTAVIEKHRDRFAAGREVARSLCFAETAAFRPLGLGVLLSDSGDRVEQ